MLALPPTHRLADAHRAAWSLAGLAAVALSLAALYADPYRWTNGPGSGLPNIGVPAPEVTAGLLAIAVTSLLWAALVASLASPQGGRSARGWVARAAAAERRHPFAWAVAAGLSAAYAAVHVGLAEPHTLASLELLTEGRASTPFQYRALVPWSVAALRALPGVGAVSLPVLYAAADALGAFAVWAATRRFLGPLLGRAGAEGHAVRSLAALAVFVPLALGTAAPWRYAAYFFPYDTWAVAAFALGLALMQERRWRAYAVLFVVATLNRETSCFLTIAWVLAELGRVPLARLALGAGAQLAVWLGLKAGLATLYAGNATLGEGAFFLSTGSRTVLTLTAVPGWVLLGLALGGSWVVLALLAGRVRRPALRRWFRVVPVFALGMAFVGILLEVRIWGELAPLVTAGLLAALADIAREASDARTAPRARASAPPPHRPRRRHVRATSNA